MLRSIKKCLLVFACFADPSHDVACKYTRRNITRDCKFSVPFHVYFLFEERISGDTIPF